MSIPSEDAIRARRERERIAFHEAGHACAAWRVGATLNRIVTMPPDPNGRTLGSGGCVWLQGPRGLPHQEFVRRRLLTLFAGPEAQRRYDPALDVLRTSAADYADAERIVGLGFTSSEVRGSILRMVERQARSFVQDQWHCIEALAQALIYTPVLEGPAAIAILQSADAKQTARSRP